VTREKSRKTAKASSVSLEDCVIFVAVLLEL
jgi:hypothetical protein